jgi:predicted RNA-binding Zn ribbon-like protein
MKFEFVGGQPALDFVNTASRRDTDSPRDRLTSYSDLVEWASAAHALPECVPEDLFKAAAQHPAIARQTLDDAREFREALYRIFKAFAAGADAAAAPPADMDRLNAMFKRANAHRNICCKPGNQSGAPTFDWRWDAGGAELDRVLWPVALAAADLLIGGDPGRVKECGGEHCNWLFLDASKNRSRRWCTMQDCGNRVKARRHYAKRRAEPVS